MSIYCVCQTMCWLCDEDREIVLVFKSFMKVKDLETNTRCTIEGLLQTRGPWEMYAEAERRGINSAWNEEKEKVSLF